jgi:putative membrane protein
MGQPVMTTDSRTTKPDAPAPHAGDPLSTILARGRTHLANERTHLAYLRTTVSLIGFGITINRFSTYLIQNNQGPTGSRLLLHDASNAGYGMVVLGLALLVWSLIRYWHTSQEIERGTMVPHHRATTVFTIGLLLLGGFTALWLFMDTR